MPAARPTSPLRNALRLDRTCCALIDRSAELRDAGHRIAMRRLAREAVWHARLIWRDYATLPPAA